jgi:hypothetical protein
MFEKIKQNKQIFKIVQGMEFTIKKMRNVDGYTNVYVKDTLISRDDLILLKKETGLDVMVGVDNKYFMFFQFSKVE